MYQYIQNKRYVFTMMYHLELDRFHQSFLTEFSFFVAKSLKVGGCRLYLSLFLIGEVNNPQRNTWKMDQNEEGGIDLYYNDATGAMMITFDNEEIAVNRMGSAPSMNYLMHETGVINGMLDQLDEIAFDTSIHEKDRLILLKEGDEIDVVRESLSFN